MLIFRVVLEHLSGHVKAGVQDRCDEAHARISGGYPVRELNIFRSDAQDEKSGGKFEMALALEDCIQPNQFASLLRDLSEVLGFDLTARPAHAKNGDARVSSSMIAI